jgi:hypothetical protein
MNINKMAFLFGFVFGLFAKDHLVEFGLKYLPVRELSKNKTNVGIFEIKLVIEITNQTFFQELYPNAKNLKKHEIIYSDISDLDNTCIRLICNLSTTEHNFINLSRCGNLLMYIKYNNYTNIYTVDDTILKSDFIFHETKIRTKYQDLICARLSNDDYITFKFKSYFNQPDSSYAKLSPKILFDTPYDLILLTKNGMQIIKNDEVI